MSDSGNGSAGDRLRLRRLGIDTGPETVIYMREDCHVCRSEGFATHARLKVTYDERAIIATLNQISNSLLEPGETGLSEAAWQRLGAKPGGEAVVSHLDPLDSLSHVRAKVYGARLTDAAIASIIRDVAAGRYSDIHLSAFIAACSGGNLNPDEILSLTVAMIEAGDRLSWTDSPVVDKHCVGGLPGNRTTPIVVAIVTACGLTMPKTSSRAITSPAGTADTMETLAPVDLDLLAMRRVVEQEGGCVVWGGAVRLSPADDVLIRVERALDLDSEGQLVASVLSKKAAAGASHVVLDLPVGPTAKVRSDQDADRLEDLLSQVATSLGLQTCILRTDGTQPVGQGIGPALEARDVLSVLRNEPMASLELRKRAVRLAGSLLELAGKISPGEGVSHAEATLASGRAWAKFQAICEAQVGLRNPPVAGHLRPVLADHAGIVTAIDNRLISRVAKLAGAPYAKAAGVQLHVRLSSTVERGEPLYTVHAQSPGELSYAMDYVQGQTDIILVEPRP